MSKKCLIWQPAGLGDILWLQPIVTSLLQQGYEVHHPVCDLYLEAVRKHMPREGVTWHAESDNFPLKELYGAAGHQERNGDLYLGMNGVHGPNCPVMVAKYNSVGMPLVDWRRHVSIVRDEAKEKALCNLFGITEKSHLINRKFGTPPNTKDANLPAFAGEVVEVDIEKSCQGGFDIFDWIGPISICDKFSSVETALTYFADMYAKPTCQLNMFARRAAGEASNYFTNTPTTYRNGNWTFFV